MATESKLNEISIDCVIFGFDEHELKILLYQRAIMPERGSWALPGGFIRRDENLEHAADRILNEITGVDNIYMEQIGAFGEVDRYSLERVVTVGYYALVNPGNYAILPGQDAQAAQWCPVSDRPDLVFDHDIIVSRALEKLRMKVRHEPVGFELLPEKFTLSSIQKLYEAILGTSFDVRNFRKKLLKMDLLIKLKEKQRDVAHRAANLYRFDETIYRDLKSKGFTFDL